MSKPARPTLSPSGIATTSVPAAVLLACFEEADEARIILTKRPDTMAYHQGEIAFPGGKHDPSIDRDLQATALREAHEEIGLAPGDVELVAELGTLPTVAAQFLLTPFVGLLSGRPVLSPDPTEVASVFDVALIELLDEAAYREERWDMPPGNGPPGIGVSHGPDRPIHFFELPGETVWGVTARVLVSFLSHLVADR